MGDARSYEWADDVLQNAACVAAVAGATTGDVLAAFGADTAVVLTDDEAYGGEAPTSPR